jgi:hypothetical protein
MSRPIFRPDSDAGRFVGVRTDPFDERIEVSVLAEARLRVGLRS